MLIDNRLLDIFPSCNNLPPGMIETRSGEELQATMDKLVLYLRIVHSIDFYSQVRNLGRQ